MQGGSEPENNSRYDRHAERPAEHGKIQAYTLQTDEIARTDCHECFDAKPGKAQSKQTAEQSEQETFRQ